MHKLLLYLETALILCVFLYERKRETIFANFIKSCMFQYINVYYNFLKNRENQVHTPISVDLFRENIKQYTAKMVFFYFSVPRLFGEKSIYWLVQKRNSRKWSGISWKFTKCVEFTERIYFEVRVPLRIARWNSWVTPNWL